MLTGGVSSLVLCTPAPAISNRLLYTHLSSGATVTGRTVSILSSLLPDSHADPKLRSCLELLLPLTQRTARRSGGTASTAGSQGALVGTNSAVWSSPCKEPEPPSEGGGMGMGLT